MRLLPVHPGPKRSLGRPWGVNWAQGQLRGPSLEDNTHQPREHPRHRLRRGDGQSGQRRQVMREGGRDEDRPPSEVRGVEPCAAHVVHLRNVWHRVKQVLHPLELRALGLERPQHMQLGALFDWRRSGSGVERGGARGGTDGARGL